MYYRAAGIHKLFVSFLRKLSLLCFNIERCISFFSICMWFAGSVKNVITLILSSSPWKVFQTLKSFGSYTEMISNFPPNRFKWRCEPSALYFEEEDLLKYVREFSKQPCVPPPSDPKLKMHTGEPGNVKRGSRRFFSSSLLHFFIPSPGELDSSRQQK